MTGMHQIAVTFELLRTMLRITDFLFSCFPIRAKLLRGKSLSFLPSVQFLQRECNASWSRLSEFQAMLELSFNYQVRVLWLEKPRKRKNSLFHELPKVRPNHDRSYVIALGLRRPLLLLNLHQLGFSQMSRYLNLSKGFSDQSVIPHSQL